MQHQKLNFDMLFNPNCAYKVQIVDIVPLKNYLSKKSGWVYIAYSKNNDLLKIGRTSKNPLERAKTLSSAGVLYEYDILFSLKFFNQFTAEKNIHNGLKKFRVSKEFFSVKKDIAIQAIQLEYEKEIKLLNRFFKTSIVQEDIDLLENSLI